MTHTCQICQRSGLNLVLEEHLHGDLSGECPAGGTDRFVREEGKEIVMSIDELRAALRFQFEGISQSNQVPTGVLNCYLDAYVSALATEQARSQAAENKTKEIAKDFELAFRLVRQENDQLQARSRALREALGELLARGSFARNGFEASQAADRAVKLLDETKQLALAAYDTTAPLPPDAAGDGELLDWLEKAETFAYGRIVSIPEDPSPKRFLLKIGLGNPAKRFPTNDLRTAIRAAIRAEEKTK